jgi:hypothetical protein
MSSPILPTTAPEGPSTVAPSAAAGAGAGDIGAFVSELVETDTTLAPQASRGGPPPEVLEQIAAAGATEERLRESGQQLRFFPAAHGKRTRIEIHDREGRPVRTLSVAEALEVAAGKPPE